MLMTLKGRDIYNMKARRDVLTGIIPATMTDSDLTNRYSLVGICSISRQVTPVKFRITKDTVDAELFALEIEDAIVKEFLRAGNVLVWIMQQIIREKRMMFWMSGYGRSTKSWYCCFLPEHQNGIQSSSCGIA